MNSTTLRPLALVLLLAAAGCQKPIAETTPPPPGTPEPIAPMLPKAQIAPEPPPAPVVVVPPAEPLAPQGVFFLLAKTSVTSEDGIAGLKPGTRLTATEPGKYADAEGHSLQLRDDQVTNNLRLAAQAAGADAATQAALRQMAAQRNSEDEANRAAAAAHAAEHPAQAAASRPAASVGGTSLETSSTSGMSKAYGQKKAFVDRDGDGRSFGLGGREHPPVRSNSR